MPEHVGKRIRAEREQQELSQSELARKIGNLGKSSSISPSTISRIEEGIVKKPRQKTLRMLEAALGLDKGRGKDAKIPYLTDYHNEIVDQLNKLGLSSDAETRIRKNRIGCPSVQGDPYWTVLWEFITECWNLRTWCRDYPVLAQHYIRVFQCTMNFALSIPEIDELTIGTEQELWEYLIHSLPKQAANGTVKKLASGAQIILAKLFREISSALGDRLMIDAEWMFARRAFEIYLQCQGEDTENELLFELAITIIPAAAYSLNMEALDALDIDKRMFNELKKRADTSKNRGALYGVGIYYASCKEDEKDMVKAVSYFHQLERYYDDIPAIERPFIGNLIVLWCCEIEIGTKHHTVFQELFKIHDWFVKLKSSPLFLSIALVALAHPGIKWQAILEKVKNR